MDRHKRRRVSRRKDGGGRGGESGRRSKTVPPRTNSAIATKSTIHDPRTKFPAHFGNATVFGRPGQPAELALIYVQLATADASFTTGNI
jgi:hypothetical protein